jgi:hypothetical protein
MGPDPKLDFSPQGNVVQQFADMTERLKDNEYKPVHMLRQTHDPNDKLVMASLQGNWTHRHHPYRPDKPYSRDDHKHRDSGPDRHNHDNYKGQNRNKHAGNWRERRHQKKSYNYRRD